MKLKQLMTVVLSTAMIMSTVPASAADFADITVETDGTDEDKVENSDDEQETDSESAPEVSLEDDFEENEETDTVDSEEVSQESGENQIEVFSDGTADSTPEAGKEEEKEPSDEQTVTDLAANGGRVINEIIPVKNKPIRYRVTLTTGGCLTLKGNNSEYMTVRILENKDENETEIKAFESQANGSFENSYELAQGVYLIEICGNQEEEEDSTEDNTEENTPEAKGTFNLETGFTTQGATTFQENSNDTIETASQIALGQKIRGHLALNNQDDYYKIVIPSNGKYTFRYKASNKNVRLQHILYNSAFREVKKNIGSNAESVIWELPAGTYYYRMTVSAYEEYGFYDLSIIAHVHTYQTTSIKRATLQSNGSILRRCSGCGTETTSTIYKPAHVLLTTTSYTYNGGAKTPGVVVTDMKGAVISSSTYQVTYEADTKSAGKHGVKVTFKGKYSGSTTRYYRIKPRGTSISKLSRASKAFTVKVKKQPAATATGYQVQYSIYRNFKGAKTRTFNGTSLKVSKLKRKKNYYVRVRTYKISGNEKYYSSWSTVRKIKTK